MGRFLLLPLFFGSLLFGAQPMQTANDVTFHMDQYARDLHQNTLKGRGHAYLKKADQEVWADEVEIDFKTNWSVANGNVHIREGALEIWCRHANYALSGAEATFDDATIISGQFVLTGATIRKIRKGVFEAEEATYTNCNLELLHNPQIGKCDLDWKIYGRRMSVEVEHYVVIHDALLYLKSVPLLYLPVFMAPVKTLRQSGMLMPHFTFVQYLGSGFEWPYFAALGPWHDLTIDPTFYTERGYHLGVNYRYIYSPTRQGMLNFYVTQWHFGSDPSQALRSDDGHRTLGIVGEWAVTAKNVYSFGERSHARIDLRLVSDPYYTQLFAGDLDWQASMAALRSQVSITAPGDDLMLTGQVQRHQSLIISQDFGSDQGPVTELPTIRFSKVTAPLLGQLLSYELDSRFSHFYRPVGFDSVPSLPQLSTTPVPSPIVAGQLPPGTGTYAAGDYIRTGQRLQVEPRLIANVPMPPGFQFQPVLTGGTLAYEFQLPQSSFLHREYLDAELPLSMYLSRTFDTGISGFEKISHVFQPRVIYADSLYQSAEPSHPFFFSNPKTGISNPRFDLTDFLTPYRYARVELINRFRRKTDAGAIDRFFLIQLSNQYNFITSPIDPRFQNAHGPIELLSALTIGPFSLQAQALYQLDTEGGPGNPVHDYNWSSTLTYQTAGNNHISLTTVFNNNSNASLVDQTATLDSYLVLPTFFDISGSAEYSMRHGELVGYSIGFYFAPKPHSCWNLSLVTGRSPSNKQLFTSFNFSLIFGDAANYAPMRGT